MNIHLSGVRIHLQRYLVVTFVYIIFFIIFFVAVPSSVPTSEALLPRRSSRHPPPSATPRAIPHRGPAPRGPQEETSDRWYRLPSGGNTALLLSHFGGVQCHMSLAVSLETGAVSVHVQCTPDNYSPVCSVTSFEATCLCV